MESKKFPVAASRLRLGFVVVLPLISENETPGWRRRRRGQGVFFKIVGTSSESNPYTSKQKSGYLR